VLPFPVRQEAVELADLTDGLLMPSRNVTASERMPTDSAAISSGAFGLLAEPLREDLSRRPGVGQLDGVLNAPALLVVILQDASQVCLVLTSS
jgi:hypothetical protein